MEMRSWQVERRKHARYLVRKTCLVHASGLDFHSVTIDVSLGGVRVELPSLIKAYLNTQVRWIEIDGLPRLGITVRWKKQLQFGASFAQPRRARPFVEEFLLSLGPLTTSNEIT